MIKSQIFDEKWEYGYNKLLEYYNEHGHCNVPQRYVTEDGYRLGNFVDVQRRNNKANTLSNKRKQLLENINFTFKLRTGKDFSWDDWYKELEEYYKEYGDSKVALYYITKSGHKLGMWVRRQISVYNGTIAGILTDEQIEKLEKLEISWYRREDNWEQKYDKLEEYLKTHDRVEDSVLKRWYYSQKYRIMCGKATKEEIKLLSKLGITAPENVMDGNAVSDYIMAKLDKLKLEHSDPKVIEYFIRQDYELGKWFAYQKQKYANGKLEKETLNLLNKYGLDLCPKTTFVLNNKIENLEYKKLLLKRMKVVLEELDNSIINSKENQDIIEKEIIKRVWR